MASIFCPDCGARAVYTLNKPKFCQTCGKKFGGDTAAASTVPEEEKEEEVPMIGKLDYSIEMEPKNVTLGELFNNPLDPNEVEARPSSSQEYQKLTKEEFLSKSMAECAPRQEPQISEDGTE
jgi:hypothetical protein